MEDELREIILASTSTEQNIGVWDVQTGTLLTHYKGNSCGRNALSTLGPEYLVAAQSGKGQSLNFWTWNKDQIHQRSFTPQQIVSLACSPCGIYCAAGSAKGTILIWETASGKLLRYWSAHYKAVNDIAFTKDTQILVSGGEDAVVSAWLMMDLLDVQSLAQQHMQRPFATWTQHLLPVTSIFVGAASGDTLILSASLDKTCKIWSLNHGKQLESIPLPVALHSVVMDHWESCVYLGGADGRIFQADLQRRAETDAFVDGSTMPNSLQQQGIHVLSGHARSVSSLACTMDSFHLVSGSEDGMIKVWDVESRQCLRTLAAKGPISNVIVLYKPLSMAEGRGSRGKKRRNRQQPLGVFGKQVEVAQNHSRGTAEWRPPPMIITGTQGYCGLVQEAGLLDRESGNPVHFEAGVRDTQTDLQEENRRLQEQIDSARKTITDLRTTNSKLHAFVVQTSGHHF